MSAAVTTPPDPNERSLEDVADDELGDETELATCSVCGREGEVPDGYKPGDFAICTDCDRRRTEQAAADRAAREAPCSDCSSAGISPMKRWILASLVAASVVGCGVPDTRGGDVQHHNMSAGSSGAWSYLTGTTGTVTVAAGFTVNSVSAHATSPGATVSITPGNAGIDAAATGGNIPIVSGATFTLTRDQLATGPGGGSALRGGSVIVFTSTDSYLVALGKGG